MVLSDQIVICVQAQKEWRTFTNLMAFSWASCLIRDKDPMQEKFYRIYSCRVNKWNNYGSFIQLVLLYLSLFWKLCNPVFVSKVTTALLNLPRWKFGLEKLFLLLLFLPCKSGSTTKPKSLFTKKVRNRSGEGGGTTSCSFFIICKN